MTEKEKLIEVIISLVDDYAGERIDSYEGFVASPHRIEKEIRKKLQELYALDKTVIQ